VITAMELTVVGCSGSVSGPDSPASCYLIRAPYEQGVYALLLDLGPGAFGALYNYIDPAEISAIGFSHLHPDHCLDLCSFYIAARYSPTAPWPQQIVYGPAGTAARIGRAYEVLQAEGGAEPGSVLADHFQFRDWGSRQEVGPFILTTARVRHPVDAYAIRVEETRAAGASMVFSGDTGPCDALVDLAKGADLLLAEASYLDGPDNPPMHLTGRQAAEAASRADVGALVLTHVPPWHDRDQVRSEATPHFAGPIALALPGASWSIGNQVRA
jgi:ribonuclease BN (tRNA processing enzyme)